MIPHLFREVMIRDTDRAVPFTLCLQEHADYFVPHRHHYIEFSYVVRGAGTETVDGRVHPLLPGTFSLLLPSQVHTLHARPETPVSLYVGGFGLGSLSGLDSLTGGLERRLLLAPAELPSQVRFLGEDALRMEERFRDMLARYEGNGAWDSSLFLARLLEVLAVFDETRRAGFLPVADPDKALRETGAEAGAKLAGAADRAKIAGAVQAGQAGLVAQAAERSDFRHIVHYIQTHANEPISLRHLAQRFHRSESSISAGFQRLMGGSYLDFLHDLRIRDACALLRASSLSVTEVAVEVGYESYETFARVFRQRKGMPASAWRRRAVSPDES